MSFGGNEGIGFATKRGRDWPSVRQFNIFLENKLGALLNVVRRFESTDVRIISLTIVDSADCAIVRLVLSDPERASDIFRQDNIPMTVSDLLVVQLPEGPQPLLQICKALLAAELNIHYAYPLLIGPHGKAAVALHVDALETAVGTLSSAGFVIFTEAEQTENPKHQRFAGVSGECLLTLYHDGGPTGLSRGGTPPAGATSGLPRPASS
jgi:hypothetical protein